MRLKTLFLGVFLAVLLISTHAWAASKSVSYSVSCSVPSMIELSAANPLIVENRSNTQTQFQTTEDLQVRNGQKIKLYSLTAL